MGHVEIVDGQEVIVEMVGYILKGTSDEAFKNLAAALNEPLLSPPEFQARPHRTTTHSRTNSPSIRLHHMMMELLGSPSG